MVFSNSFIKFYGLLLAFGIGEIPGIPFLLIFDTLTWLGMDLSYPLDQKVLLFLCTSSAALICLSFEGVGTLFSNLPRSLPSRLKSSFGELSFYF